MTLTGRAFSDDTAAAAVRRRRVVLTAGAITLTSVVAPRLLSAPGAHAAAVRRPAGPPPVRHERSGHRIPDYPHDRPLYYVDAADRAIALTIDDGPDPVYTPQVLRLLALYRVTATFSMIGLNVAAYPELARAVAQAGHHIANHTWTHANLAQLPVHSVQTELTRASESIHAAVGSAPALFRAPYGSWSAAVIRQCERMKMVPVDWSVDPRDWSRPGTRSIIATIMRETGPGSIILEHDGGGNRSETVAALGVVLPWLLQRGYRFVAV